MLTPLTDDWTQRWPNRTDHEVTLYWRRLLICPLMHQHVKRPLGSPSCMQSMIWTLMKVDRPNHEVNQHNKARALPYLLRVALSWFVTRGLAMQESVMRRLDAYPIPMGIDGPSIERQTSTYWMNHWIERRPYTPLSIDHSLALQWSVNNC